jgi:hypothetical protein
MLTFLIGPFCLSWMFLIGPSATCLPIGSIRTWSCQWRPGEWRHLIGARVCLQASDWSICSWYCFSNGEGRENYMCDFWRKASAEILPKCFHSQFTVFVYVCRYWWKFTFLTSFSKILIIKLFSIHCKSRFPLSTLCILSHKRGSTTFSSTSKLIFNIQKLSSFMIKYNTVPYVTFLPYN